MNSRLTAVCLFMCVATPFMFSTSVSAQTIEWTFCAPEGGVCAFTSTMEVRYGANGSFFYKTLTDGTACTNSVFGDPLVGTAKQCAVGRTTSPTAHSDWTYCASEGGVCAFTGTVEVRYGANGSFFYKTLTDGTACTNTVFGDPAPGTAKHCAVGTTATTAAASDWTFCATEGALCAFTGTQEVRYGANGSYFYKTSTGGTACTNTVFGDPAPGTPKQCDILASSPYATDDWALCASEGGVCAFAGTRDVRYGANGSYFYQTVTDGTACTNSVFGDPAVGTPKHCDVAGIDPILPPPSSASYGPRTTITCPAGSLDIWPGSSVPDFASLQPAGSTYCLRAGIHYLTSAITPKSGDTFVGEYGAILDGSRWSTSDTTQAAFRAHNQDIDNVTIRNLVIRKMPQKGIQAFYQFADRWTIEFNEIASNKDGLVFPNYSLIRNNYIHHNVGNSSSANAAERGGGYIGYYASYTTFDTNEIAYNGWEQKVMDSVGVTFRNNFVHHNVGDGIWYDGGNPEALIEGNRVEDNGRNGIFYEAGIGSIIRNNTLRRNRDTGVFISTSQNSQIYSNTLEHNFRGITYFVDCGALSDGRNLDLKNNAAQDNTIRVGTQSNGPLASAFSYTGDCTSTQVAQYQNGSKNLTFSRNTYYVPSLTGWFDLYWLWDSHKYWNEWQALGHDLDGLIVIAP